MKRLLSQTSPGTYWALLCNYLWYKWSSICEGGHPMLTGAFRLKDRHVRRPGIAVEGAWAHFKRRAKEVGVQVRQMGRLFLEMEELWLQTQPWTPAEYRVVEAGRRLRGVAANWLETVGRPAAGVIPAWPASMRLTALAERFRASRRVAARRWAWFMSRWQVFSVNGVTTRQDLARSWRQIDSRQGFRRWFGFTPLRAAVNAAREVRLALSFAATLVAHS